MIANYSKIGKKLEFQMTVEEKRIETHKQVVKNQIDNSWHIML